MEKKTTAKLDETKSNVKAAEAKVAAKAEETKAAVKEKVEEKKTAGKTVIASKAKDVAAETKNAVEETKEVVEKAKETVKETVKEKRPSRISAKASAKEELRPEIFIQFQGNEAVLAEIIEKAKGQFVADGHRVSTIKSLQVYLKPEESAAYYVINQKFAGRVDMF